MGWHPPIRNRLGALRDCYKYFDDHSSEMAKIARAMQSLGDQTRRNLENSAISRGCQDLLIVFEPISQALDLMQRQTTTLAEAVEIWVELLQRIPRHAGGYSLVVERSKQALECPFFLLANVLDHRLAGANLRPEQIDKARQFCEDESDVAAALNLFLARSGPFRPKLFDQMSVDPLIWWSAGKVSGFPPSLVDRALRLNGCLASTANLERNFSTMGHVYGRRRTNLGVEKAGKLTFLFRALNDTSSLADLSDSDDSVSK